MDAKDFGKMIKDKHFYELKKMQYKYSAKDVTEMLELLKSNGYDEIALNDFKENPCVYLPGKSMISTEVMKKLLISHASKEIFSHKAMEEEIESTLQIENIQSNCESVRRIFQGAVPENGEEHLILGMKKGIEFIGNLENKITEENLYKLYMVSVGQFLRGEDSLPTEGYYRNDSVYVVDDKSYHMGLDERLLPEVMEKCIDFAASKDRVPELVKACILHFYIAYLHPYFDGNGRIARLIHLWYLVQQGFSSTLFYTFSKYINESKKEYYHSFVSIEENFKVSGILDITPFIIYFRDYVYQRIGEITGENLIFEIFKQHKNQMQNFKIL